MENMVNTLAPIVLFVYNRLEHTKKTIEYLKMNDLAHQSILYIYSDAPKKENQIEKVKAIRDYIHTVNGFKNIVIVEADKNKGLANSIISGVTEIIHKYGKVIVLEDDLLTTPCFIKYMNEALTFYDDNKKIWSITGYQYPFDVPKKYRHSVYLSYRGSSWSWATWEDRWLTVDWSVADYSSYRYNPFKIAHFCKGGTDLDKMLRNQMKGVIDSWAIRWCYSQSKQKKYTIYPCKAIVTNNGTDGTGTHFSTNSDRYKSELAMDYKYEFTHELEVNHKIMHRYRKIVNCSILRRIKRLWKGER